MIDLSQPATPYEMAAARGHDLAVLSELLPAAEAGMIEALGADAVGPD